MMDDSLPGVCLESVVCGVQVRVSEEQWRAVLVCAVTGSCACKCPPQDSADSAGVERLLAALHMCSLPSSPSICEKVRV